MSARRIWIPQAIATAMLLWALVPSNPYAYYTLLRWVACPIFAFLAIRAAERRRVGWAWILGATAAAYNPVVRMHLTRELWTLVNLATIGVAIASISGLGGAEGGATAGPGTDRSDADRSRPDQSSGSGR